jgi:hypothetical protein
MSVPERNPEFVLKQMHGPMRICLDVSKSNRLPKNHPKRYHGVINNFIKAIQPRDQSDYAVSVHDDMELIDKFESHVQQCLLHAQSQIVSFYVNGQKIHRDNFLMKGRRLYKTQTEFWPPALAIPTEAAMAFTEWMAGNLGRGAEDEHFKRWLKETGRHVVVVYPSMCEHAGYDRSTQGNPASVGNNVRKSGLYNRQYDFENIDWKTEFEKL